jgi:hypothetical protein
MRKWMFACAVAVVAGFLAETVSAQEPIAAPTTEIVTVAPRGGLFRRARERRMVTVVSQPTTMVVTQSPAPMVQAQATDKVVTTPMATTMTQPQYVEVRSGLFGRGRRMMVVNQPMTTVVTQSPAPMVQAQATETPNVVTTPMATTTIQPQAIEVRRGLFGRVRYR